MTTDSSISRAERVDRFLSLAAGLAAITAVAVSLYQAALARQQLRASAWPYLAQGNSYAGGTPYLRIVSNEGVGPARVRSFQVLVDGKPVKRWGEVIRAFSGQGAPGMVYSSFGRGIVMPPGTTKELLHLPPGPQAEQFFVAAQTRLHTVVCYCSVYDECWVADTREEDPKPVDRCDVVASAQFEE